MTNFIDLNTMKVLKNKTGNAFSLKGFAENDKFHKLDKLTTF